MTAFHQLNTENNKTEVEILHTLLGLYPRAFAQEEQATTNPLPPLCRSKLDKVLQSIELKIDEDRARNVLSRACFGEESVERIVSSINGLVVEYPPVSFVALASFVSLVHLPSLCVRVGLSVGGVVGEGGSEFFVFF